MSKDASAKKTVVIAEDDHEVAQALGRIVRMLGHDALIAENGVAALELLRANKVEVLLTDVDMPEMDGVTLATHARSEMLAPVRILLTANSRLDLAIKAINTGEIHRYIQKPWKLEELVSTLEDSFLRIDDLTRMAAAGQAARRLRAACEALEVEYPGLTHLEKREGAYEIDLKRADQALALLEGTTLAALLTSTAKLDQPV